MKIHKGFTLAEVLITLAIIGVIAALTIPSLQNMHQRSYREAFKKGYAEFSSLAKQIIAQDGDLTSICKQGISLQTELEKRLEIADKCVPNCISPSEYQTLSGADFAWSLMDDGQFSLTNGTFVAIENPYGSVNPRCIAWLDVNGYKKGPNKLGIDTFGLEFLNNRIIPSGAKDSSLSGPCSRTLVNALAGGDCAAYVLRGEDY